MSILVAEEERELVWKILTRDISHAEVVTNLQLILSVLPCFKDLDLKDAAIGPRSLSEFLETYDRIEKWRGVNSSLQCKGASFAADGEFLVHWMRYLLNVIKPSGFVRRRISLKNLLISYVLAPSGFEARFYLYSIEQEQKEV